MGSELILADGTEIELETGASLEDMQVVSADKESMVNTWSCLTNENLKEVQIKNSDGLVVANYTNLVLVSEKSVVKSDGAILTSFHLREKTEIELRLEALEEEQAVQNGAIEDLGIATSEIAQAVITEGE